MANKLLGSLPGEVTVDIEARSIQESGGTSLQMGAVSDGAFLKRSGTDIVGATPTVRYAYQADVSGAGAVAPSTTWTEVSKRIVVPGTATGSYALCFKWSAAPVVGSVVAQYRLRDETNSQTILSGSHAAGTFTDELVKNTGAGSNFPTDKAEIALEVSFGAVDAGTITLSTAVVWEVSK